jgi:energy-coupling factor transporter ATP-binding protein EcfA2
MSVWDSYPTDYRAQEVQAILTAVRAGECVSLVGLSGAGKSNLMGFLEQRSPRPAPHLILVDGNRLPEPTPAAFFSLVYRALGEPDSLPDEARALEAAVEHQLGIHSELCLLLDRFEILPPTDTALFGNLRALRDAFKYRLTYVISTRRPLDPHTELAELFFANTLWLGPLNEGDALWNVKRYAARKKVSWKKATIREIVCISWGYPSLLRAVCEAVAEGAPLNVSGLASHPAVVRRVEEFWADQPGEYDIRQSRLEGHPLLMAGRTPRVDDLCLTAKEHLLLEYFRRCPDQVCEKDDLIRAVWPEDKIYERGVRDESLAQLVRRLREKIEPDPSNPNHIHTVPGRGYRYTE